MSNLARALMMLGLGSACVWPQSGTAPIVVDYPANHSVFPPDMAAPTFLWRDTSAGRDASGKAVAWKIDVVFADGSDAIHVASKGERMKIGEIDPRGISATNKLPELTPEQAAAHTWKPDDATWAAIKAHSVNGAATVTISGPASRGSMQLSTSADPVGAPIFYRDVPLMPSKSDDGVIRPLAQRAIPLIAWRLRDVAQPQSRVLLQDMPTCANCHSFSRDGSTLGMDLDGPDNDKGLYAIAPVKKTMSIGTADEVSWTSFKGELGGQLREGFMSQVSPDGRYVVTTIRPPGSTSGQFYYVANFEDYRFLQVFYPTRGILVWYDRAAKKLQPLPGADDPNFVQANATWSPDGKYLIFARAAAKDPQQPGVRMAAYANDPLETPIQYDLYRIPFNDGKGGKAERIEGASQNGMSNSFAKISPDGRWIVFVQAKNGLLMRPDSQLYIVPAAGGQARRLTANTKLMNSWHSFSPNGRWLVFSSKSRSPYTQMFLTHIDAEGRDTPAILIENSTAANRAVNIPEFVNIAPDGIDHIDVPATDFYRQFDVASKLTKKGDHAAAIVEWNKAMALSTDDARAHNDFGVSLAGVGRMQDAIQQYRDALALRPNYPEARDNLGNALASAGRLDEAIVEYRQALETDPKSSDAHNNLGTALTAQGHLAEAIPQFEAALAIRPEYAEAENNLGNALAAENRLDDAMAHFRKALELDPGYADADNNLGAALARQGKLDEATTYFLKAVELKPDGTSEQANLGRALLAQYRVDEAVPHLEKALATGPETADLHNVLGMALVDKGRPDQAIAHFEKALALEPGNSNVRANLGQAYTDTKNAEGLRRMAWMLATSPVAAVRNGREATVLAQRAVEISGGKGAQMPDTLAAAYAETGQFDKALETAGKALAQAREDKQDALAADIAGRIASYEAQRPFRAQP